MSAVVVPDRILKELAAKWVEQGKQGAAGVLRACSMTLIVVAEESEDAQALGETIASIVPKHPARAILVRLRGAGPRALGSEVTQQCWRPFGRQQICCERIDLTASDAALADVPPVLLALLVADLPVILWCRSPRITQMPEFGEIARIATKVIVDSAAWPEPAEAIRWMADARHGGLVVGDLAWTRLTRLREMLARVFENREYLARVDELSQVTIRAGRGLETAAWYLGAWTTNALPKAKLAITRDADSLAMELEGEGLRVSLGCEGGTLVARIDGLVHCTNLPRASDSVLMQEELSIVRRDTVFERALSGAARIAISA